MGLISNGIDNVRAFELPNGIWTDGRFFSSPRIALVRWRSSWEDKFYQVYVNGQYAGTTIEVGQRQLAVQTPSSFQTSVTIEVFAIDVEDANVDFSDEIDSPQANGGRVKITFLRSQNLPINSTAQIYFDAGTGQIDYDNPVNDSLIRTWPSWQDKAGFGMSKFGLSDFGFDSAAAIGFGKGSFGYGQFGLDADIFEWLSEQLAAGVYKFAVKITDSRGNESAASETGQITVIPSAQPAKELNISSFDKDSNQLVLSIS